MEQKVILGLDISTNCTGISVVYVNEKGDCSPIIVTHLRPKIPTKITGIECLFLKCNLFMEKLGEILIENKLYSNKEGIKDCRITDIVIEEPLLLSNNAETVASLLRYNGIVAQNVYNMLGIVPQFISSYDARKYGMPTLMAVRKYKKNGDVYPAKTIKKAINDNNLVLFGAYPFDCAKKMIIWNYIQEKYPEIQWVYNKKNELKTENFDASDSLICVLGYVNKLMYGDREPEVVCYSTDETPNSTIYTYSYNFCNEVFTKSIEIPHEKVENETTGEK